MNDFDRHVKIAKEMGEKNFCAVAAVASACYQDFDFVHRLFTEAGRPFAAKTQDWVTFKVLNQLNRTTVKVTDHYYSKTVKSLEKELKSCWSSDILLVWTRGHILCIREGEVLDWTKDRLHRIKRIEKVLQCAGKRSAKLGWTQACVG